ncbi:MAG: YdeI/OmpD-associated family protein [Anaerolineales bacterium]
MIDSTVKTVDGDHYAQRFSPRRAGSKWSEMNKERVRRLIRQGRMTRHGLAKAPAELRETGPERSPRRASRIVLAPDVRRALQRDRTTWENFRRFPQSYRRIRIGWIEGARRRPQIFQQRLRYFLKMTAKNKMFGMVR